MRIRTSHSLPPCLAVLLLMAPASQAQTLRGVVRDEAAGVPIEGARLLLLDGVGDVVGTTLSDKTGAFLLQAAASGRYLLRVEGLGYTTYTSRPIFLAAGTVRVQLKLGIDAIPLEARIIAVCDAFDTITSDTSYKKAQPFEEAVSEIETNSGTQFDPAVVETFMTMVREGHIEARTG